MTNKRLGLLCTTIIAVVLLGCYVWCALLNLDLSRSDGSYVVDGSRLRFSNCEIFVTNSLSINVRPTQKTSEWIYVYGTDSEILINGNRLDVGEASIRYVYDGSTNSAEEVIKSELPVLLRFFEDKVIVAGSATWTEGQIVIENDKSSYDVMIRVKKECRIVVKGNWYEFTG